MVQDSAEKSPVPESAENVPRDDQVLELAMLVLGGTTVTDAAKELGISRTTAHRRMNTPEYRAVVTEARALASRELLNRLLALDEVALKTLTEGLVKVISSTRLSALRIFMDARKHLVEEQELRARLDKLEEAMRERGVIEGKAVRR
jgi:hypothetical protein